MSAQNNNKNTEANASFIFRVDKLPARVLVGVMTMMGGHASTLLYNVISDSNNEDRLHAEQAWVEMQKDEGLWKPEIVEMLTPLPGWLQAFSDHGVLPRMLGYFDDQQTMELVVQGLDALYVMDGGARTVTHAGLNYLQGELDNPIWTVTLAHLMTLLRHLSPSQVETLILSYPEPSALIGYDELPDIVRPTWEEVAEAAEELTVLLPRLFKQLEEGHFKKFFCSLLTERHFERIFRTPNSFPLSVLYIIGDDARWFSMQTLNSILRACPNLSEIGIEHVRMRRPVDYLNAIYLLKDSCPRIDQRALSISTMGLTAADRLAAKNMIRADPELLDFLAYYRWDQQMPPIIRGITIESYEHSVLGEQEHQDANFP